MILKDPRKVIEDYGHQRARHNSDYEDYELIESYFGSHTELFNDVLNLRICNNEGQKAFNRLVEFISGFAFSPSGDWIRFKTKDNELDNLVLAHELQEDLQNKLKMSNFYHENTKIIGSAFKWCHGFMDVQYSKGLSFISYDTKDLVLSVEKGSNQRAYLETDMTTREILSSNTVDSSAVSENMPNNTHKILIATLPNNEEWFEEKQPSDNKWIQVALLYHEGKQIIPKKANEDMVGYKGFPYLEYRPHTNQSLCREVLKDAAFLNYYCIKERDRTEIVVDPPYQGPYSHTIEGGVELYPNAYIQVAPHEKDIRPITTLTGGDQVLSETIQRLTLKIREVFRVDEIKQFEIFAGSQYEYHRFVAAFYKSLFPLISSLSTSFTINLLERTMALCMTYDEEFKKKYGGLEGNFCDSGFVNVIADAEKMAKVGMFGQAVAPFAQADKNVLAPIHPEKLGIVSAKTLGLHDILKTPQELAQDMQQQALQQQEQEMMQSATTGSEIELKQAQAQAAREKGE